MSYGSRTRSNLRVSSIVGALALTLVGCTSSDSGEDNAMASPPGQDGTGTLASYANVFALQVKEQVVLIAADDSFAELGRLDVSPGDEMWDLYDERTILVRDSLGHNPRLLTADTTTSLDELFGVTSSDLLDWSERRKFAVAVDKSSGSVALLVRRNGTYETVSSLNDEWPIAICERAGLLYTVSGNVVRARSLPESRLRWELTISDDVSANPLLSGVCSGNGLLAVHVARPYIEAEKGTAVVVSNRGQIVGRIESGGFPLGFADESTLITYTYIEVHGYSLATLESTTLFSSAEKLVGVTLISGGNRVAITLPDTMVVLDVRSGDRLYARKL